VLGALPPGVAANLSVTGTQVVLNVTSSGEPRWNGNVTGGWDLGTNQDWFDLITLVPTVYSDGKPVVFDDNATGTTTVTLTGTVKPAAINFNNDVLPYTIVGSGLISGTTGLNINGTTNVTIANTGGNSFTGPVTINSGTLSVASLANGGSPSAIGASSSNPTNLVIVDGVLNYTGASVTANRGFTVGGTNATINTANNLTLGGNVAAAGNVVDGGSGFIKMGPGQLDLTAVGDNEFANNYNPGVQIQNGTFMLDGSLGSQTNHTVGDFYVGNTTTSGAAMILTNTILNVDGWLALGRINGGINNTSTLTAYNSTVNCGHLSLGWDGNLPNNLSSQFITLNGTSTLTDGNEVNLAEGANASFTLNINNNSLFHVTQPVYIAKANNATGTVVVANSGQLVQVNGWFDIAAGANSIGSLTAKNTSSLSLDGDCNLADTGSGAIATLTAQDNATVHANNLYVGKSSSSIGTVNITNSATINMGSAIRFADGANSTGTVNVEGGSLVCTQYINMAGGSSSTATLNIMGGSVTGGNDCTVGDQATAVVNLVANGGGVLTVPNTLYLSRGSAAANGTVNLNVGSTVICGNINNGWAFNEGNTSPTFNPNAFNFNGGTLEPVGAYSYVFPNVNMVVQSGGAVININSSTAEIEMGAALVNGGGAGGLTKLGAGILRLDGVNTFTGTTLVSSGTFEVAGNGVIAGPVSVASGATLAGDIGSVETFYINNTLTLAAGSTTTMTVTPASNDEIFGLTTVNYGGALVVTNSSTSPLVAGHTYMLFNSANPGTGNFSSVTILPSGQFTGTFNPANGSLTIVAAAAPTFNSSTLSGGNLVLTGTGGTPSGTYSLLTATNLTTPIASWTTNTTGTFDTGGAFSNAIPVNATTPAQFFRMKTP